MQKSEENPSDMVLAAREMTREEEKDALTIQIIWFGILLVIGVVILGICTLFKHSC